MQLKQKTLEGIQSKLLTQIVKDLVLNLPVIEKAKIKDKFIVCIHKSKSLRDKPFAFSIYDLKDNYIMGCPHFHLNKDAMKKAKEVCQVLTETFPPMKINPDPMKI